MSIAPSPVRPGAATERTTAELARFIAQTTYDDLPEAVIEATKQLILDEIVVTAAAMDTPMAKALLRLKGDQGGRPEATLMIDGRGVPAASAAYVHGQVANLLDADETMHNRMHVVSASVMAGLAVAELTAATGRELIAAVATGYELAARIGISLRQYVPDGKGGMILAPIFGYSWMSFGAAATAGRLLGLDGAGIANALGQAYVTSPVAYDMGKNNARLVTADRPATWHKYQMSGASTEAGVNAALLTQYGWVAQDDVLDDGEGFWQSFGSPGCDFDVIYRDLSERWHITETSIKPYPFCRLGHAALDVFSDIVETEGLSADDIDDVFLRMVPHQVSRTMVQNVHADESLKLMLSLPTALALVALRVPAGPEWFKADLTDARIRAIAAKVRSEICEEWGATLLDQTTQFGYFREIPTEVVVRTRSGRELHGSSRHAQGDPWSDATKFGTEQFAEKAHRYLANLADESSIDRLVDGALTMDHSDHANVARSLIAATVRGS